MLRFPEVRAYVLAALANETAMGEAEVSADGRRKTSGSFGEGPPPLPGAFIDKKVKYRVCDFYAWQLSRWEGMPAIELTWPEEMRNAAVAEGVRLLKDPGGIFDKNLPRRLPDDGPSFRGGE